MTFVVVVVRCGEGVDAIAGAGNLIHKTLKIYHHTNILNALR